MSSEKKNILSLFVYDTSVQTAANLLASLSAGILFTRKNPLSIPQVNTLSQLANNFPQERILKILIFTALIATVVYLLKQFIDVCYIGIIPYANGQVMLVNPIQRDSSMVAKRFGEIIRRSDKIKIVMINGGQFFDNPSETNLKIKNALIERAGVQNLGLHLTFYLLDPDSEWVKVRASERCGNNKAKVEECTKNHRKYCNDVIETFESAEILFYDRPAIFQIMVFCEDIFVCGYPHNIPGRSTYLKGYQKQTGPVAKFLRKKILKMDEDGERGRDYELYNKYIESIKKEVEKNPQKHKEIIRKLQQDKVEERMLGMKDS